MKIIKFEEHGLSLIEHNGKLWLKSSDIARALGYARSDRMARVYDRHRAEFSSSMTCILQTPSLGYGSPPIEYRLFSLRGAHLLGMFSRTAVGAKFRRWVLDQLEEIENRNSVSRSLMAEWFEAKAALDGQEKFASLCGKGLSDHKKRKPPLLSRLAALNEHIQPSLFLS